MIGYSAIENRTVDICNRCNSITIPYHYRPIESPSQVLLMQLGPYRLSDRDLSIVKRDHSRIKSDKIDKKDCNPCPAESISLAELYSIFNHNMPPIVQVVSDSKAEISRVQSLLEPKGIIVDPLYVQSQKELDGVLASLGNPAYAKLIDWQLTPNGNKGEGIYLAEHVVIEGFPRERVGLWSKRHAELSEMAANFTCLPKHPVELSDRMILNWLDVRL
ncbi:MAG TPA: hypothetical protein VJI46_02840 [Candidatus Nanoarchaeia archaeon]|nr:hypothetical protein [Candidatus Nanoarchaeia archaeon]